MERLLARHTEWIYAALRIMAGTLFAFHGIQKIFGLLTTRQTEVFSQLWIGGIIELIGGALIAVGLLTRWAAFLCSGTMAVAYIQFHWKLQMSDQFWPIVNRGELALLYCFLFLFFAARGAGKLSLDSVWRR
jgi:putative oxidoreductase